MDLLEISQDSILKIEILQWKIIRQLSKRKKQVLEKVGLTSSQFDILFAISYFSNTKTEIIEISLSELSDIDPIITSAILRSLEKKGLIKRHKGTTNKRAVLVELTNTGLNLVKKVSLKMISSDMKMFTNTDIDMDLLISLLKKVYDKLKSE